MIYQKPVGIRNAITAAVLCFAASLAWAQKTVLVVSGGSGDYLMAAGGTLAKLIDEGHQVYVVQFANDEKNSRGLTYAETRLRNNEEGEQAARMLGIREIVNLNHKSGELGQVSSNEIRNQIFALIRYFKPAIIFHPDPFIHYEPDWDHFFTARAAEESSYGSSSYFLAEIGRMGFPGHGVRETYYFAARRPYRPGEGGHNGAEFRGVDVTARFQRKLAAILALRTANHAYAASVKDRLEAAGKPNQRLTSLGEAQVRGLATAFATELAAEIGKRHGFRYAEEFNYHGPGPAIPAHVREKARKIE